MTQATLWLLIVGMGVTSFGLRGAFLLLLGRRQVPPAVERALRFVPPAVLSALIAPELLYRGGALDVSPGNHRLVAGLLAALVAWRTKNVPLTIGAGMAALLALEMLRK